MQAKALATPTVPAPTLTPSGSTTVGTLVSLNVTVGGALSKTPTGGVDFQVKIGSGSFSTIGSAVALNSGGSASTTYTPQSSGNYQFQVDYSGDTNYVTTNSSSTAPLTVTPGTATVSVPTLNPVSPIVYGSSVTATATVSGGGATSTGTVQFQYSTNSGTTWTNLDSAATLSGGLATSTSYTPTAAGNTYQLRVSSYSGDTNYNPVTTPTSAVSLTVNQATPLTNTVLSQTQRALGQSVTDTATVSAVGSGVVPTGTVTFQISTDGGNTFTPYGAAKTLASGSATSDAYTATGAGTLYFRAVYSGDTNYATSQSANTAEPLTITQATATVGAATFTPASPITLGTSVTVSASVTGPSGATAPTGNVQFEVKIGAGSYTNFGSPVALSGTSASTSYTPQAVNTYSFEAVYQGDGNYVSGTTGAASGTLTVNKGTAVVPAPTLNPSGSATAGTPVSLSVTISGNGVTPTGSATFQVKIGGGSFSTIGSAVALNSGGSASATYTPQSSSTYQFQVEYSGDSNYNAFTGSAASLTVNPAGAAYFVVSGYPTSTTAGVVHTVTVVVYDTYGNVVTNYAGSVKITSSDSLAGLPGNAGLASGVGTFSVILKTAGSQSINASDSVTSSITGSQSGITVNAASALNLLVSGYPSPTVAGVAHTVIVTAKDAYNNTVTGYSDEVKFASSDGAAVLPPNGFLASGVGSFSVTLKTVGSQSITATDTSAISITGSQSGITVNVASGDYFVVTGFPSSTVAGVAHAVTVTVKDAYNNTVTGYTGMVEITSSDSLAGLPANAGLTNGVGSFSVTLETAGSQSITATDSVTSSITGVQNGIMVNAAGVNHFVFDAVGAQGAGSAFGITVTAEDAFNNTVTGYTGNPSLTYSVGSISPTAMGAFVGGVGSTSVTVNSAGLTVTITATDGAVTGTSNSFSVTVGPTPTPTPASTSTSTPSPTPQAGSSPTPTPSPTSTLSTTTVTATTTSGATVNLAFSGYVTSLQVSHAMIISYLPTKTTTVSFTVTGANVDAGFINVTIPKTAVYAGSSPEVYINGLEASNQGYTQDAHNFYVYYTASLTAYQASIQFLVFSTSTASLFGPVFAVAITVPEIVLVFTIIAVRRLKRKPDNA
jgi:hypothetical protein